MMEEKYGEFKIKYDFLHTLFVACDGSSKSSPNPTEERNGEREGGCNGGWGE